MISVGLVTIGQAPRDDVVPDMVEILGRDVHLVQAGALDGLGPGRLARQTLRQLQGAAHVPLVRLVEPGWGHQWSMGPPATATFPSTSC